jgi:uncharacterized oxidoreductase
MSIRSIRREKPCRQFLVEKRIRKRNRGTLLNDTLQFAKAKVLITGGSEGIGRGLAERFLAAGSPVLVTGRNAEKLKATANSLPGLLTFVSDISKAEDRAALAAYVGSAMAGLNVLINNAGIQRRVSLAADTAPWPERQVEIDTLLSGPIHLNALLIPGMLKHGDPSLIVNVTSGGAFIPQVFAPVYSACKAALHSYTVTLRHSLKGTAVKVTELIPPAVETALAGLGATHGAPLNEFCDQIFSMLGTGAESIGFGPTSTPQFKQLIEITEPLFLTSSSRFPVATYAASTRKS